MTITLDGTTGIVASGNVTAATFIGSGSGLTGIDATKIQFGTSEVVVISSGGNVKANVGGSTIATFHSGGIDNALGDGVGNIGETGTSFNTVFAKATSAQYADLAEKYITNLTYPVGTVMAVGEPDEARWAQSSDIVIGVISLEPAIMMNSELANGQYIGLKGRVPVRVIGPVLKGQAVYAANNGVASINITDNTGLVGVSLETNSAESEKLVECVLKV